jgi:hypothetical protein
MGRGRDTMPAVAARERAFTPFRLIRERPERFGACPCITLCAALVVGAASGLSAEPYTIQSLRWQEDYSYLRDREDLPFPT